MSKSDSLEAIYQSMVDALPLPLAQEEKDIVPGEGKATAKVLLIGEAPGYNESVERRPFVGRSGQLLRKTLTTVNLPASEVYISNIVKARPPDNRDPSPAEIAAYKPFLDREIHVINPALIVTLGRFSMQKFLPQAKISQVHGRLQKVVWQGKSLFILPMYHPAAALRGTAVLTAFTADFNKVSKVVAWVEEQQHSQKLQDNVEELVF